MKLMEALSNFPLHTILFFLQIHVPGYMNLRKNLIQLEFDTFFDIQFRNQAILKFSRFTCSSVLTVFVTFVYFWLFMK